MKKIINNLWRLPFFAVSAALAVLAVCLLTSACALPTWLSDANSIIPMLVTSAGSVLSLIAGLTGNAALAAAIAALTTWANKIEAGLANIETLIANYQANPSDTLLENIEAAAQAVISDIPTFAQVEGLPAALATTIQSFAQLILTQLEAWTSLIPTLKASVMEGEQITVIVPFTKADYKAQWNALLNHSTGDPTIDAALKKAKRL